MSKKFSIDREKAVDVLTQLGLKKVDKEDNDGLGKLLKKVVKNLDDGDDDDLNKKGRRVLDDVTDAVKKKREIEVTGGDDDDDDDEDEKSAKKAKKAAPKKGGKKASKDDDDNDDDKSKKKGKGKKGSKADKKSGKKGKSGGGGFRKRDLNTDRGGKGEFSLKTQQGHEINRLISKGPMTIAEIAKKGSKNVEMTEKRVEAHVNYLADQGRVTVTKQGKVTLKD